MFCFVSVAIGKLIQRILALTALFFVGNACAVTVWIDTDPAIGAPWRDVDDAFALLLAVRSPELEIAGISTSYGNASLPRTTAVANDLVRRFGAQGLFVYPGAQSAADLGHASAASEALADVLRHENHVTYVALAPLTNLASFGTLQPQLLSHIDRVYFVGGQSASGALHIGHTLSFRIHDANVFKDPEAADRVLASSLPVTLAPAEVGAHLMINAEQMWQLRRSGPAGDFVATRAAVWFAFWRYVAGERGGALFDCLPLLALTQPRLVHTDAAFAIVAGRELRVSSTRVERAREVTVCASIAPSAEATMASRLTRSAATRPNR